MFIEALAMASPRVRAAVHRHVAEGLALVPLLREAHRQLLEDAAELMAVAGAAPFADTPVWPGSDSDDGDEVSEAQLLALVAAADRREVARVLVTRRAEAHSASMLPGPRGH
ncbi:MAG: hypothetical protein Q8S73_29045 [Deltaproteobacteria bacterium]|nr:hypothetical protein [Myxococcales bacterium]MDP3218188.1 hypothetical protein [Deltaproteobacteria bacterium]